MRARAAPAPARAAGRIPLAPAPFLTAGAHQMRRGRRDAAAAAARWRLSRRRDGGEGIAPLAAAAAAPLLPTTPAAATTGDSSEPAAAAGKQRKVALFVEPSPFSHVSGMKNRFECLIKGLTASGDDVVVFTPDHAPPRSFAGASVVGVLGFRLPFYRSATLLLSLGLSVRVLWTLWRQRPDVIHASTPGVLVFAAVLYARLFSVPLVMSYHTHIPEYIPRYTWKGLVEPMWSVIRWCTRRADLTLVTSAAMADELARNRCRRRSIDVWQRGVDTDVFNPRFRSVGMRARMVATCGGADGGAAAAVDAPPSQQNSSSSNRPPSSADDASELEDGGAPLLLYVGRLGAEKNVGALKEVLERVRRTSPQASRARLVLVGDGPCRADLEAEFAGDAGVAFMGMMRGPELSEAYASADVLLMPSETETLGFVALEAMASGVPVVAVAAGGLTDIIAEPGRTGLLYPPGDYAAAAAHAAALVADPSRRRAVGAAGRREVERFGWAAATRKIRESQYVRAIRLARGKLRFKRLLRRVRWGAFWRWLMAPLAAAVAGLLGGRRSAGGGGGGGGVALAL